MSETVQANLKDGEKKVIPNTTTAAVYDLAKGQALSATLLNTPDKGTLGYPPFTTMVKHPVDQIVYHLNKLWRFNTEVPAGGAWDASKVDEVSIKDLIDEALIRSVSDPRIKLLSASDLEEGDMLFYDRLARRYCTVAKAAIGAVLADYDEQRYETNYDTYVGTLDGKAHFVAITDAYSQNGMYTGEGNTAAANNYYRIDIDNTQAGSITFSATSGNGSVAESTISWEAEEEMSTIVGKFTAKNSTSNYIVFAALADGKGVGLKIGGSGTNTLTVTANTNCTVVDCSMLSFLRSKNPSAPLVGGDFNPAAAWTYLNHSTHLSFRGSTARTILGSALVDSSTTAIAVDGYNYSYRCGLNFAKWKAWATTGGESTFYDDGEDEQSGGSHVADPGAHVMNEATFNAGVRDYTGNDAQHLGMKDYYTHLFTDQSGEYATRRQELEAMYGQMTSMYDAYLMNHMLDPGANSGITSMMRNKGFSQTVAKADLMTVTYDYKIIPAYPPEYNAQQYGIADSEGFAPGVYYHPEPADLALRYRDDNFALVNANVDTVNAVHASTGTKITDSEYRGSCADYRANDTWCFYGANGCFSHYSRCTGYFRCRPSLALPLPD